MSRNCGTFSPVWTVSGTCFLTDRIAIQTFAIEWKSQCLRLSLYTRALHRSTTSSEADGFFSLSKLLLGPAFSDYVHVSFLTFLCVFFSAR